MNFPSAARATTAFLFLLVSVVFSACREKSDPVQDCIDALVRSANHRDSSAFVDRLAAEFQAADGSSRADVESLLRRYFAAYEILDVTVGEVTVEKTENAARVRFQAQLSGQPRKVDGLEGLLPRSSSYDFDMRLVPEAGKWKVAWASWQPHGG